MLDFDEELINEYKRFPAFYNRECEGFKDKVAIEGAWKIIGRKLCYNADTLKSRMLQLRSRYTFERRKLETKQEEGTSNPESSWGLFHNLNFLSDHIKQRRPYRTRKLIERRYNFCDGFPGFNVNALKAALNRYRLHNNDLTSSTSYNNNIVLQHSLKHSHLDRKSEIRKRIQTLKQSLLQDGQGHPTDKTEAFGSFLTMSLQNLQEKKALELIGRFTREIVRAMTEPTPELSNSTMCDSVQPSTSHKLKAELIELRNARALQDLSEKEALVTLVKLSSESVRALIEPTPESSNSALCATIQPSTSHKIKTELIELENASSA